jgi:N-methylhydantoinase A/oxoprolinase/acetone carboxylase beta subunit
LKYAVYTPVEEIIDPQLEFFSPKKGDPADYVCIKLASGKRVTLTNSCAANVLGLCKETDYSYGNQESARLCMQPLAEYLGLSVEETANQILHKAYEKIYPVIDEFAEKYRLERDQITLVGVGGGAAALLPYSAKAMKLNYSIPQYAEVISSIGVALAMIRDVVERVIPNPTTEDIKKIKREAAALAIKSGAVPATVEVHIEIDPQSSRVTAIALGSNEVQATDLTLKVNEAEARDLAAESMNAEPEEVETLIHKDIFFVFGRQVGEKQQVRLVDHRGFIKVQCGDAVASTCQVRDWEAETKKLWDKRISYRREMVSTPDVYLCIGGKVLDFSNTLGFDQLKTVMASEFSDAEPDEEIILICARNEII